MQTVLILSENAEVKAVSELPPKFTLDDAEMKFVVRDLHRASPAVFWTDLGVSALVGWSAFFGAVVFRPFSTAMLFCLGIAVFALYRCLCFMHEITHQSARTLPGFETAWNWLIGFPLLMPSFMYVGVHQDHHRVTSYGTEHDPEYLPFAHSWKMTTVFALESFFIPLGLLIRFLVLTPIGLLSPVFQKGLVRAGSALTMNVKYRRAASEDLVKRVRRDSVSILALWIGFAILAASGVVPWHAFLAWLAMLSLVSFLNTLRTLGAHAYENQGAPLDRAGQLLDSIDTPGAFWTELWAPIGLRYHALHHYFPGVPYHNLPEAYRRVVSHLPVAQSYRELSNSSLPFSLRELYRKGFGIWTNSRLARR